MTTYNFTGFGLIETYGPTGTTETREFRPTATLQIVMPDGDNTLSYANVGFIGAALSPELLDIRVGGANLVGLGEFVLIEQLVWSGGNSIFLVVGGSSEGGTTTTDETFIFRLAGDPLPAFANLAELEAFEESEDGESVPVTSGPFAPNTPFTLDTLPSFTGLSQDDLVNDRDTGRLIATGAGNDRILGNGGNDTLRGGDGADTLNGGAGDDFIFGGDTVADLRDVIYGGDGADNIDAGYGNDEIYGGIGFDTIEGGFGADTIYGQEGNDTISGSAFGDLLFGGANNDFINGGFGSDRMNGGTGADRFYHLGIADHGSDWTQDYTAAEGDLLVSGRAGATAAQFQVNLTTTAGAGAAGVQEAFVIYRPTGQILWALVDGAGQDSINIQIGGQVFDLMA